MSQWIPLEKSFVSAFERKSGLEEVEFQKESELYFIGDQKGGALSMDLNQKVLLPLK